MCVCRSWAGQRASGDLCASGMLNSAAARWLPRDFVEASQVGGVYTLVAYVCMFLCFLAELRSFMVADNYTALMLDPRNPDLLQINFDVDLYDLECRNLKLVVYTQGWQSRQEPLSLVASDFWLRSIDSRGRPFGMAYKPTDDDEGGVDANADHERQMKDVIKQDGKQELDADWASSHDGFKHKSFEHVIEAHDFTMINFFAEWCSHCRQFAPTWDMIAAKIHGDNGGSPQMFADRDGTNRGVRLIRMNCVDFKQLCHAKGIDAYPTIRLYKADGSFSVYEGKRDEADIIRWLERTIKMKSYGWSTDHEAFERGCNAKGRFQVPRVPGHLELMAGGGDQNLNPRMTNVSHKLNHLSFSDPEDGKFHRKSWSGLPSNVLDNLCPLDGVSWATQNYHEAYVHDIKVVGTMGMRGQTAYQFSHTARLSRLPEDVVPQAQFHFDIEPFSIQIKQYEKKWYDFCTSVLALLGGLFVMMRVLSQVSRSAMKTVAASVIPRKGFGHNSIHLD